MIKISSLTFAAAATILAVTAPAQAEACRNGICASSRDNGSVVTVRYYVKNGPVSHVNLRMPNGAQGEVRPRGSFNLQRFAVTRYAMQVCVRSTGLFGKSSCGPWANFRHNSAS